MVFLKKIFTEIPETVRTASIPEGGFSDMTRDMTQGNITEHLVSYAVPLLFGNLFQQLYHTVDSVVVGQFDGKEALAAVGAAGPIMNILTFLIVGLSMGASILMSNYFGARRWHMLKSELATSVIAGFLFTVFLSILSFAGSSFFIRVTQTPEEIAPMATTYLQIISLGLIFTFFYNVYSSALRAIGDSRPPLYVLIITTFINVFLDIFLVGVLDMGVTGAAVATVISQLISSVCLILYIRLRVPILWLTPHEMKLRLVLLKKTVDFSSVSALQQTVLYLGRLLVQSGVNALGVDAVAAFNAVSILDSYVLAPGDSLASSLMTFCAQNRGGKQYDRIPAGFRRMMGMATGCCAVIAVLVLALRRPLTGIFLKPEETLALAEAMSYLVPMASFYFLSGITNTFQGYFRGIGRLNMALAGTFVQIPVRVAVSYALFSLLGIQAVAVGTALGWTCMAIFDAFMYRRQPVEKS